VSDRHNLIPIPPVLPSSHAVLSLRLAAFGVGIRSSRNWYILIIFKIFILFNNYTFDYVVNQELHDLLEDDKTTIRFFAQQIGILFGLVGADNPRLRQKWRVGVCFNMLFAFSVLLRCKSSVQIGNSDGILSQILRIPKSN
jgi:hypothetical protein